MHLQSVCMAEPLCEIPGRIPDTQNKLFVVWDRIIAEKGRGRLLLGRVGNIIIPVVEGGWHTTPASSA